MAVNESAQINKSSPSQPARSVFSRNQTIIWSSLIILAIIFSFVFGAPVLRGIWLLLLSIFLSVPLFRLFLTFAGSEWGGVQAISQKEMEELNGEDLPIYTVLVPIFQEKEIIPLLVQTLKDLSYPPEKLDLILLIEEDDYETLRSLDNEIIPDYWRKVIVPFSLPQTKPKACNYGLRLALGEFLTVYNAEDVPESNQLKKALIAHKKMGSNGLCVQGVLNYYNYHENAITALYSLEYCYEFDYLLAGLDYFQLPVPLDGTSNHFRTHSLIQLGGWDSYNMSEQIDLGMKAYTANYKVGRVNFTTFTEAPSRYRDWLGQRTRWMKGMMQTALVYNRQPLKRIRSLGAGGWFSFQLLVTATPLMHLIHPIAWLILIIWAMGGQSIFPSFLTTPLIYFTLSSVWLANFIGIYLNLLGIFRRKLFHLVPIAILNPFYWLAFHSVAAYRALWQLFFNPFYWEKTTHGISKYTPKSK